MSTELCPAIYADVGGKCSDRITPLAALRVEDRPQTFHDRRAALDIGQRIYGVNDLQKTKARFILITGGSLRPLQALAKRPPVGEYPLGTLKYNMLCAPTSICLGWQGAAHSSTSLSLRMALSISDAAFHLKHSYCCSSASAATFA